MRYPRLRQFLVNDKQHNVKMPSGTISEISRKWARRREEVETTGLGERDNGDGDWGWGRGMETGNGDEGMFRRE